MTEAHGTSGSIRTPDQRLRVFVSSTLAELADERTAVAEAVSALRLTPVLFELGARPHPPRELYRAYLAQSDVFVGLYWQRYGWIGPDMEVSGLEDEFQLSGALPRLLYVKAPAPDREERLTAMIDQLQDEGTESYRSFTTPDELDRLVRDDLAVLLSERFLVPSETHDARDAPSPRQRSLPVAPTSLLGREQDIAEVSKLLAAPETRLVTLTGPGGIGKTRLALAVAEEAQQRYAQGAVYVSLAALTQPELVLPQIAAAIGVAMEGARPAIDAIAELIGESSILLVLDNLEQVVEAAPDVDALLARCSGLEVLATSRTVLRLRAECEYPVNALAVPQLGDNLATEHLASVAAVQLFVERASAVRYDFALTADNGPSIAEICRRLDGLPLAIELAAARARLLEPPALLARLERGLDALGSGPVDLPERQRTLRATVEWSIGLLDDASRDMLTTLSVFVDGWTIDAAVHVADLPDDRTLDLLDALAGHSLVRVDAADVEPRFRMVESVRELAAERLAVSADLAAVARRHAECFGMFVLSSDRPGQGHEEWASRLRLDEGNIRRAVSWYFEHDITPLPDMFRVLWLEWQIRDRMPEGQGWLDELLRRADELADAPRVQLFLTAAVTASEVGDDETAVAVGERLAQVGPIDDPYLASATQLVLAWVSTIHEDFEGALPLAYGALEGFRQQDGLGVVGFAPFVTASALLTVGMLEMSVGTSDEAHRHLTEAKEHGDRLGVVFLGSGARTQLAWLAVTVGDLEQARTLLHEALDVGDDAELGTHPVTFALVSFAKLLMAEGDAEQAAFALGAADNVRRAAGLRPWASTRPNQQELVVHVEQALGADRFASAFAAGSRLDRADAIALVRSHP